MIGKFIAECYWWTFQHIRRCCFTHVRDIWVW